MKIKEEFPLTVPKLSASSGYHVALVKKLMPAADKWSGTTPRWRAGRILPKFGAALLLPSSSVAPAVKLAADILPADVSNVVRVFDSRDAASAVCREFMAAFWSIPARGVRAWLVECSDRSGGRKL